MLRHDVCDSGGPRVTSLSGGLTGGKGGPNTSSGPLAHHPFHIHMLSTSPCDNICHKKPFWGTHYDVSKLGSPPHDVHGYVLSLQAARYPASMSIYGAHFRHSLCFVERATQRRADILRYCTASCHRRSSPCRSSACPPSRLSEKQTNLKHMANVQGSPHFEDEQTTPQPSEDRTLSVLYTLWACSGAPAAELHYPPREDTETSSGALIVVPAVLAPAPLASEATRCVGATRYLPLPLLGSRPSGQR